MVWGCILFLPGKQDDSGELTEKEIIRAERNSGVISNRVREIQVRIYFSKMAVNTEYLADIASWNSFLIPLLPLSLIIFSVWFCDRVQLQNALRKKEQKELRAKDLREGLQLYK